MKFIGFIINSFFILLMLSVSGLFLLPLLPIDNNLQLKIVESGSMEPQIMTGSLVAILPSTSYQLNEVITFKSQSSNIPTTHRIVESYQEGGQTWFVTKGDANEDVDGSPVIKSDVIGSVRVSLPYVGFVLDFARQPIGFIFLIVLPAILLIISEVEKIWLELKRNKKTSRKEPVKKEDLEPKSPAKNAPFNQRRLMMDISNPVRFSCREHTTLDLRGMTPNFNQSLSLPSQSLTIIALAILFSAAIIGSSFFGSTLSYLNDTEKSLGNFLQGISIDFAVFSDGSEYSFEDGRLLADDDGAIVTIVSPEPDSADMNYDVSTSFVGGNILFCDAIMASSTVPVAYAGPITTLTASNVQFSLPWSLSLSLPDSTNFLNNENCQLDIVFTAWHYDIENDEGYFDEERTPLTFSLIAPEALPAHSGATTFLTATLVESTSTATSSATTTKEIVIEITHNDDTKEEDESEENEVEEQKLTEGESLEEEEKEEVPEEATQEKEEEELDDKEITEEDEKEEDVETKEIAEEENLKDEPKEVKDPEPVEEDKELEEKTEEEPEEIEVKETEKTEVEADSTE